MSRQAHQAADIPRDTGFMGFRVSEALLFTAIGDAHLYLDNGLSPLAGLLNMK